MEKYHDYFQGRDSGNIMLCSLEKKTFFFHNLFYLFIYLFLASLSLCCSAQAPHCGGFSCYGAQAPGVRASVVAARGLSSCGTRALEHRLRSCGIWA